MPTGPLAILIKCFADCVRAFEENAPFRKFGQLEHHLQTIRRRRELGSATAATTDESFQHSLYQTLQAWGIGRRRSRLVPFSKFVDALQAKAEVITQLDHLSLGQADLKIEDVSERVWKLMEGLAVVENEAKLVACSKCLHHILPELVVPIDRAYTRNFFEWNDVQFQYDQERCFKEAFASFVAIAQLAKPETFVGGGWNSSRTKVIDNAIVGLFILAERAVGNVPDGTRS